MRFFVSALYSTNPSMFSQNNLDTNGCLQTIYTCSLVAIKTWFWLNLKRILLNRKLTNILLSNLIINFWKRLDTVTRLYRINKQILACFLWFIGYVTIGSNIVCLSSNVSYSFDKTDQSVGPHLAWNPNRCTLKLYIGKIFDWNNDVLHFWKKQNNWILLT